MQKCKVGPPVSGTMTWCGCFCDAAEAVGDFVVDTVSDAADAVLNAAEEAMETIGGWIEDAARWVGEKAEDIAEFVGDVATKIWDWITETASSVWDWIKEVAGDVWEWTTGALKDAWDWVSEAASDVWDWIEGAAETVWNGIVAAAEAVAEFWEEKVVPFLLDVLWVLTHIDEFIIAGVLGLTCLITGQDEKEYDVIEGMFILDEEAFANRSVAFLPVDNNYVIFSDLHLFVAGDSLDKFRQIGNHELYQMVLASYYVSGHTLMEIGDIEDLWMRETTLEGALLDTFFDVTGFLGDALEQDYEDTRVRTQAVKIFENNADVYQTIRNLFHDTGRYVRTLGNHDDYWRSDDYLPGLQVVYPGIEVFDYAFIGNYGADRHEHGGNPPRVIVAHGHQIDAWNNSVCRAAGEMITAVFSGFPEGIPYLAEYVVERSEWEDKLRGQGFDNELSESIASIDEVEFYRNIRDDFSNHPYVPHFILGHTHHPLKDPLLPGWSHQPGFEYMGLGRFSEYTNDGTAGRWEQFIWCVTVESGRVGLHGWTWGSDGQPLMYTFAGNFSDYLQPI